MILGDKKTTGNKDRTVGFYRRVDLPWFPSTYYTTCQPRCEAVYAKNNGIFFLTLEGVALGLTFEFLFGWG